MKFLTTLVCAGLILASPSWAQHARPSIATRISIPGAAHAFASDGEHIYIGHQNGISKFRMSDNVLVERIALRNATPAALCWDGTGLWYAVGDYLYRMTPGGIPAVYSIGQNSPDALAFDGEYLWVGSSDPIKGYLSKVRIVDLPPAQIFDRSGVAVVQSLLAVRVSVYSVNAIMVTKLGILFQGDSFFQWFGPPVATMDRRLRTEAVFEIRGELYGLSNSALIGLTVDKIIYLAPALPRPVAYCSDGSLLWMSSSDGTVLAVATDGTQSVSKYSVGGLPGVMAAYGGYIWVANSLVQHDGSFYVSKM
jgi:hypothetical protein